MQIKNKNKKIILHSLQILLNMIKKKVFPIRKLYQLTKSTLFNIEKSNSIAIKLNNLIVVDIDNPNEIIYMVYSPDTK